MNKKIMSWIERRWIIWRSHSVRWLPALWPASCWRRAALACFRHSHSPRMVRSTACLPRGSVLTDRCRRWMLRRQLSISLRRSALTRVRSRTPSRTRRISAISVRPLWLPRSAANPLTKSWPSRRMTRTGVTLVSLLVWHAKKSKKSVSQWRHSIWARMAISMRAKPWVCLRKAMSRVTSNAQQRFGQRYPVGTRP